MARQRDVFGFTKILQVLCSIFLTDFPDGFIINAMVSSANKATLDFPDGDERMLLPCKYLVLGDEVSENQRDEYGTSVQAIGAYGDPVYIGRSELSEIVVKDDPYASRIHCRIRRSNGKYYLKDINSTNGTIVEGTEMIEADEIPLQHGDLIIIGTSGYVMLDLGKLAPREEKTRLVKRFNLA